MAENYETHVSFGTTTPGREQHAPQVDATADQNDESSAFNSLLSKLVQVPKSEIDEKRQKS